MAMGRKRKDGNPLGLEPRVEWHHGQFRYLHRDGRKEALGADVRKANERAKVYNDPDNRYGLLGYWIDTYIADAKAGRLHKKKAPRTIADYEEQAVFVKAAFERNHPEDLVREPNLIADYRDRRSKDAIDEDGKLIKGAPVRANREMSLLSATYSWLIEKGHVPGLVVNPVTLIGRNGEKPKERYVEDHEYAAVLAIAQPQVRMAMELTYRTLQRPSDTLSAAPAAVRTKAIAGTSRRVLSVLQGKTGTPVDIEVTAELERALMILSPDGILGSQRITEDGKVRRPVATLVHTRAGKAYTEEGMGAMLRRYCGKAKVKTFGLMDVRAKGATDMYLAGIPLEVIQRLMAHASVTTTEIYIKRLLRTVSIAAPNDRKVSA